MNVSLFWEKTETNLTSEFNCLFRKTNMKGTLKYLLRSNGYSRNSFMNRVILKNYLCRNSGYSRDSFIDRVKLKNYFFRTSGYSRDSFINNEAFW